MARVGILWPARAPNWRAPAARRSGRVETRPPLRGFDGKDRCSALVGVQEATVATARSSGEMALPTLGIPQVSEILLESASARDQTS